MKLEDFFISAPSARPVSPRKIEFTAVAKGNILPGGKAAIRGKQTAAKVIACLTFVGGEGLADARIEARRALRERYADPKSKLPEATDENDFSIELTYQTLYRALREYNEAEKTAGDSLFASPKLMRELVEITEANRIMRAYNSYVDEEHPEVVPPETFPEAQS